MAARSSVIEELGSEIHVIFIDAPPVQHASIAKARANDGDDDAASGLAIGHPAN